MHKYSDIIANPTFTGQRLADIRRASELLDTATKSFDAFSDTERRALAELGAKFTALARRAQSQDATFKRAPSRSARRDAAQEFFNHWKW